MQIKEGSATEEDYNPYAAVMGVCYNQLMFNLTTVRTFNYKMITIFQIKKSY
jgi:hypothetical protein